MFVSRLLKNGEWCSDSGCLNLTGFIFLKVVVIFFQFTHNPTKGVCPICLLVTDGSTLARHLKKKHFLKHHLCTVCGKEFDMLLKMQVHMSTAHAEITGSTRIVCEQVRDMIDFIFAERLG